MGWRALARRAFGVLVVYGVTFGVVMILGCADSLLLHPRGGTWAAPGAERRIVPFDGGDLEVFVAKSEAAERDAPRAVVVDFGGNASRAEGNLQLMQDLLAGLPVEIWALNYPGYGGSGGDAELDALPGAGLAAFDAAEAAAAGLPMLVSGNSLGACVALHVAAERPARGLVLINPPPLRDVILRHHGWWNLWLLALPVAWQVPGELSARRRAGEVDAPVVFLTALDDEIVPPCEQRRVIDAHGGAQWVVPFRGGHNDFAPRSAGAALEEALVAFWKEAVGE